MAPGQGVVSSIQLLVIIAFLANLSEVDEWKWLISFAVPCTVKHGEVHPAENYGEFPLRILWNHC